MERTDFVIASRQQAAWRSRANFRECAWIAAPRYAGLAMTVHCGSA